MRKHTYGINCSSEVSQITHRLRYLDTNNTAKDTTTNKIWYKMKTPLLLKPTQSDMIQLIDWSIRPLQIFNVIFDWWTEILPTGKWIWYLIEITYTRTLELESEYRSVKTVVYLLSADRKHYTTDREFVWPHISITIFIHKSSCFADH